MLYSFGRIKILTRSKTKSSVATAAYHCAGKMKNEWDGVTHDFSYKRHVGASYILMPPNAPAKYTDESIPVKERLCMIWNDVEQFEKSMNAQLARQNYLALQEEFTLEQNLECVNRFIIENCIEEGMGVTYSVHLKPGNPHVDLMYLMREFDKKGNLKNKSQKEYLCRNKSGEEKYLSAEQFKTQKDNGWEKIYKCINAAGKMKNLTNSELEKEHGFKKKSKYPLDRKVEVNTWNDSELAKKWRKSWEVILNEKFEELGMEQRVSCLSNKERGLSAVPTVHEGHGAGVEERKEYNKRVVQFNKDLKVIEDAGYAAIEDTVDIINYLQHYEQTPEDIEAHEEDLAYNEGVINAIVESDLLQINLMSYFKSKMDDLRDKARRLIEKVREFLKMPQKGKYEAQRLSIDEIISHGHAEWNKGARKDNLGSRPRSEREER